MTSWRLHARRRFFTELRQGGSSELFVCAALERARLRRRSGKDSFVMIAVASLNYLPSARRVLNSYIKIIHSAQEGCLAPENRLLTSDPQVTN